MKIAYRRFADMIRKKQREKKYTQLIQKDHVLNVDFDQQLIKKEQILLMNIAMENIKPIYKQILTMKYIEDKTVKEIAEKMEKNIKATESMLMRAKDALKTEIRHISNGYL